MVDYLVESMAIAIKGSIGMVCIILVIFLIALVLSLLISLIKAFLPSPKPAPEVDRRSADDVDLEEDKDGGWKIIDGGKDNEL